MARGRGNIGDRDWGAASFRATALPELDTVEGLLETVKSMAPNYLADLRPGQKKLNDEQFVQIKIVEELGMHLEKEITTLQKKHYGDAIKEAKQIFKERVREHERAVAEYEKCDQAEIDWWEPYGREGRYYEHYDMKVLENLSEEKWGWEPGPPKKDLDIENLRVYKDWDYNEHPFEWARFWKSKEYHDESQRRRELTNKASTKKRETREAASHARQRVKSIEGATYNQAMLSVMSGIRQFGGADDKTLSIDYGNIVDKEKKGKDEQIQRQWLRAAEKFPTDWLDEIIKYRRLTGKKLRLSPAGYDSETAAYTETEDKYGRKFDLIYWNYFGFSSVDEQGEQAQRDRFHSVLVHEMGHYMEKVKPELARAGNGYRVYRRQTGQDFGLGYANTDYRAQAQKLLRKPPKDLEITHEELKKNVQSSLNWQHSEVMTTGMETMVPGSFRGDEIDAKHRAFVLGMLAAF